MEEIIHLLEFSFNWVSIFLFTEFAKLSWEVQVGELPGTGMSWLVFFQFDTAGVIWEVEPQLRKCPIRSACKQVCGGIVSINNVGSDAWDVGKKY